MDGVQNTNRAIIIPVKNTKKNGDKTLMHSAVSGIARRKK
jgi:hypothetical protein